MALLTAGSTLCEAQNPAQPGQAPTPAAPATSQATGTSAATPTATQSAPEPVGIASSVAEKPIYTVPAGTKVLLELRSAINTKSAKPGDGVYLSSTFPVVVGNRVMIPTGVYVQGVVDRVQRGGRIKGKAQLDMHFTSMIFPNGTVVEIPGRGRQHARSQKTDRQGRRRGNDPAGWR